MRSENFAIVFATDPQDPAAPARRDRDDDGIPDVIERVLVAFEAAHAAEVGQLGFRAPPVEGRYRLHVADTPRGYTQALAGTGQARPSFIVIPVSLLHGRTPMRQLKGFAAHEYFHAIQKGYDASEELWINEATAAWAQDAVFDAGDSNHRWLDEFVPRPTEPLRVADGEREYGAFLFFQFLEERFAAEEPEGTIVRSYLEAAMPEETGFDPTPVAALDAVLRARGSSLVDAWAEFQVWRWDLARFEEGAAYRAALREVAWPRAAEVRSLTGESCRIETGPVPLHGMAPLAADFRRFALPEPVSELDLTTVGHPNARAWAIVRAADGARSQLPVTIGADGVGRTTLTALGGISKVVVAASNGDASIRGSLAYSLVPRGTTGSTVVGMSVPDEIEYGGFSSVSGFVTCDGRPSVSTPVILEERPRGEPTIRHEAFTDTFGRWIVPVAPARTTEYQAHVVDPLLTPASSGAEQMAVFLAVSLETDKSRMTLNEAATLSGNVVPNHGVLPVIIEIRRPSGTFDQAVDASTDGSGHFVAQVAFPAPGIWEIRARLSTTGDDDHEPGISPPVFVDVRD